MKIGTNYTPPSKIALTSKKKEEGAGDQVVLGGNAIDKTLALGDHLRDIKANSMCVDEPSRSAMKSVLLTVAGSAGAGYGAKILASSPGAGGFGTGAAITAGVLIGGFVGYTIGCFADDIAFDHKRAGW